MSKENGKTKFLTKEEIFDVPLKIIEVEVPEWDGSVHVKEMTALQIEQNSGSMIKSNGKPDYSKAVKIPTLQCARQVVTPDGKRMFSESDIKKLQQKQGSAIARISKVVREISGQGENKSDGAVAGWLEDEYPDIWKEYQEKTGAVEEAEENFTETP